MRTKQRERRVEVYSVKTPSFTSVRWDSIYGVDIDREATEVTIMSLYLKMLDEGFDKGQAMLFLKGYVLPDMTANIKCGNSLIGSDYFDSENLSLFDNDEAKKVNAFDWNLEFSTVFDLPAGWAAGEPVLLVADGIKMGATVTLNGKSIGPQITDQFLRYTFDIN